VLLQAQCSQSKNIIIIFGAEEVAQWKNVCPACAKPWVPFPSITKINK
jgi:hypothetical protein